jgi:hypothetical protein
VEADVFRPQSVGRAVRTAFVLGVLIVIALVAAFEAVHQFSALVGDNTKDELSRYLDDNAHTNVEPSGAGFKIAFPVPPARQTESVSTGVGSIAARRERALVDDEITFDAVWFQLPGPPSDASQFLSALAGLQLRQLGGSRAGSSTAKKIGPALARDFALITVDKTGAKHYLDERILVNGRRVWILRVGSRIPRGAAIARFVDTFHFTP